MQHSKEREQENTQQANTTDNEMAQNPNPRANENIKNTSFEKSDSNDSTPDVGSEITDGGAG